MLYSEVPRATLKNSFVNLLQIYTDVGSWGGGGVKGACVHHFIDY